MKLLLSFIMAFILLISTIGIAHADEASHRAAAEELLKLLKTDQMMKPLFEQLKLMMDQQLNQMGVPEDRKPLMKKYSDKWLNAMEEQLGWERLKNDFIHDYVETFMEDEIKAISAFYKTPAGQTFMGKMPLLIKKSMETAQKKMPEMMKKMEQITREMMQEMKNEIENKSEKENNQTQSKGI